MWTETPFYFKLTVKLLLLSLIVLIMVVAREFLIPFIISVFFTFLLLPVSRKLIQFRFPRVVAIITSILIAITVFGGIIYFFYSQVQSFEDDLPALKSQLNKKWQLIQQFIFEKFKVSQLDQSRWLDEKLKETAKSGDSVAMGFFSATGTFLANCALMPIYIFLLTYYKDKFKQFIMLLYKGANANKVMDIMRKISTVSQKYLKGVFLDVLILSILNSTGFLLLGLDHAILFGVLASVLNIIPYVGVMIGSILPISMALLTKDEMSYAIGVAAVTMAVQFLDNNFITPYVVGSSVSINPLTAIIVLVIGALIWGLPGMILCMPVTGMIKVVCDNIESLKPYGFIIGEEVNYRERKSKSTGFLKKLLHRH